MTDFLITAYPWIRAFHIISVIAWMAGLLYLPRLFVYHCDAESGSTQSETFKVMERRLMKAIMTPAMMASWLFGLAMLMTPGVIDFTAAWIYLKLLLVVLLSAAHGMMAGWLRAFAEDRNDKDPRFFRIANEVPTLLMIAIVILVVVEPF